MSYMKKNLKIIWYGIENNYVMIGIILLVSCLLMPAFTIISISDNSLFYNDQSAQEVIKVYGTMLAYFEGFALPICFFSYVHKRRECDFYNSMPVRRSQYFWGYAVTGIVVFLVSFAYMFVIHFVIFGFANIFPCIWQPAAMFLVIYCSMILAVCFSGSIMSTIVTFILRNCLFISVVLFPVFIAGADLDSYYNLLVRKICIFTPVTAVGVWEAEWYGVMLMQAAVAVIELFIAFFLHKYRKSETTMAVAFPKSRYPFQYIVTLIITLLVDALLSQILIYNIVYNGEVQPPEDNSLYLFIFFTVIVILIVFIFLNIILERSWSAAFSKIRHFFIFVACYGLVLFTLFNYIAPILPNSILPFKPDYAVICVNELIVSKEKNDGYANDEYYFEDEHVWAIPASVAESGAYYNISTSSVTKEAYCLTDKEKLKELVNLVQKAKNSDNTFYSTNDFYRFPNIENEEELYSLKKFTVYFVKGEIPYIQEGMSIFNFDIFDRYSVYAGNVRCETRYCFTKDNTIMEQFKETSLDAGLFTADGREYSVYIPFEEMNNNADYTNTTESGELPEQLR